MVFYLNIGFYRLQRSYSYPSLVKALLNLLTALSILERLEPQLFTLNLFHDNTIFRQLFLAPFLLLVPYSHLPYSDIIVTKHATQSSIVSPIINARRVNKLKWSISQWEDLGKVLVRSHARTCQDLCMNLTWWCKIHARKWDMNLVRSDSIL